jgi:hypothetical protein
MLRHRTLGKASHADAWTELGAPPGGLASSPSLAAWGADRLDCFVLGLDGALWTRWLDGGRWSEWTSHSTAIVGCPAVVSRGLDSLDVLATRADGELLRKWYRRAKLLIVVPAALSATVEPLVAHKRALGMSTQLLELEEIKRGVGADDPEKLKRAIEAAHAADDTRYVLLAGDASRIPVRHYFVSQPEIQHRVLRTKDGGLEHWHFDGVSWRVPARVTAPPTGVGADPALVASAWLADEVHLFATDENTKVYERTCSSGTWRGWVEVGDLVMGSVAAVVPYSRMLTCVARSIGSELVTKERTADGWGPWTSRAMGLGSSPSAARTADGVRAFFRGEDGALRSIDWSDRGQQPVRVFARQLRGAPAAVVRPGASTVDCYLRTVDDRVALFTEERWIDLGAPPGGAASSPAAMPVSSTLTHCYVRGSDGRLWTRSVIDPQGSPVSSDAREWTAVDELGGLGVPAVLHGERWLDGTHNATDHYYANLYRGHDADGALTLGRAFDDWDLDGDGKHNRQIWSNTSTPPNPDGVDGYPDVVVGRVPAHDAAELEGYVKKVIAYERTTVAEPRSLTLTAVADRGFESALETAVAPVPATAVRRLAFNHNWAQHGGDRLRGQPAVLCRRTNERDILALSPQGLVGYKHFDGSAWRSWVNLEAPSGGIAAGLAAVSMGAEHMAVFVRGSDGDLWGRSTTASGNPWGSWTSVGVPIAGAPAAVVHQGAVHVFASGDAGELVHVTLDASLALVAQGSIAGPEGGLGSALSCASFGAHVECFVADRDGVLRSIRWSDAGFGDWRSEVLAIEGAPSVISRAAGKLELFFRPKGEPRIVRHRSRDGERWAPEIVELTEVPADLASGLGLGATDEAWLSAVARDASGNLWELGHSNAGAWTPSSPRAAAGPISRSLWVAYSGHGSRGGWAAGPFGAAEIARLSGTEQAPVVYAASCETGQFALNAPGGRYLGRDGRLYDFALDAYPTRYARENESNRDLPLPIEVPAPAPYDVPDSVVWSDGRPDALHRSIARDWLFKPDGGAIAYVGNSVVLPGDLTMLTDALDEYVKADGGGVVLGEVWGVALRAFYRAWLENPRVLVMPRIRLSVTVLFGDPSLRLRTPRSATSPFELGPVEVSPVPPGPPIVTRRVR